MSIVIPTTDDQPSKNKPSRKTKKKEVRGGAEEIDSTPPRVEEGLVTTSAAFMSNINIKYVLIVVAIIVLIIIIYRYSSGKNKTDTDSKGRGKEGGTDKETDTEKNEGDNIDGFMDKAVGELHSIQDNLLKSH